MKHQCSRRSPGSCKRSAHFAELAAFAAYLAGPLLLSSFSIGLWILLLTLSGSLLFQHQLIL